VTIRDNLFGSPHEAEQDILEVWFAGVHSVVGGSYPEAESRLPKIGLKWQTWATDRAIFFEFLPFESVEQTHDHVVRSGS